MQIRNLQLFPGPLHQDACGETALYVAARNRHETYVKLMLDALSYEKVNIDLTEKAHGWTPLVVACVEGHLSIVKFLLEAGAN